MDISIVILAFQRSKQKVTSVYLTYLCHMCRTWLSSVLSPRLHCSNIPTLRPALVYLHLSIFYSTLQILKRWSHKHVVSDGKHSRPFPFPARLSSCLSLLANPATAAVSIIPSLRGQVRSWKSGESSPTHVWRREEQTAPCWSHLGLWYQVSKLLPRIRHIWDRAFNLEEFLYISVK